MARTTLPAMSAVSTDGTGPTILPGMIAVRVPAPTIPPGIGGTAPMTLPVTTAAGMVRTTLPVTMGAVTGAMTRRATTTAPTAEADDAPSGRVRGLAPPGRYAGKCRLEGSGEGQEPRRQRHFGATMRPSEQCRSVSKTVGRGFKSCHPCEARALGSRVVEAFPGVSASRRGRSRRQRFDRALELLGRLSSAVRCLAYDVISADCRVASAKTGGW